MARRSKSKGSRRQPKLNIVHTRAAGIDVGSTFHVVAVPPELSPEPVQTFQSFTGDLYQLANWLVEIGVTTVAMESTGIYWIPVFDILEAHGLEVLLVNARHVKAVPGCKTDVNDAQWLQQLRSYGLLRGSFHPAQDWSALRVYLRHRERLVEYAAAHIQHMQKALMHMNLQLHHVVSDITGLTGMTIMRAIVAGQHNPAALATYRDARCKASEETIREALTGHYRREQVCALRQALELYESYQTRIEACDQEVKAALESLQNDEISMDDLPAARHKKRQSHEPKFDVREVLFRVLGADLSHIDGFSASTALKLVGECGMDMSRWPTEKHFTSWLTLAPGNKISGGKVLSTTTRRSANRAAKIFRLSAVNVGRTNTALGAFYRRLASRAGKAKAVIATARKLAVLFYNTLRYGMAYEDPGATYYEERYRQRVLKGLRRRAKEFGYEHTEISVAEGVSQEKPTVMLSNEVECDEASAIAGHKGKPEGVKHQGRKGRRRRRKGKGGRGTLEKERPPVFGMIERGGQVVINMLANVQQKTIEPFIKETIAPGTLVYTDEYSMYARLRAWGYGHKRVNHGRGEYARDEDGDGFCEVHVNTMEGFWSLLRSWLRPHRGLSQEKLPLYLGFFEFVHNVRKRGKALLGSLIELLVS